MDTAARHPYDEVLVAGPPAPGPAPAPTSATDPPAAGAPRSALEDLLSWEDPMQSILDLSPAPVEASVADEEPSVADEEPSVADEEPSVADEEPSVTPGEERVAEEPPRDAESTTRHRLNVLLGSGALALLALAAFALASML